MPAPRSARTVSASSPARRGPERIPQIGRVVIQDDVEIGANSTIDRGAMADTVIGENTKIDNLVQIAHNVRIGRNCLIAGHCGHFRLGHGGRQCRCMGGGVGIADHLTIGAGAQLAARQRLHERRSGGRDLGRLSGRADGGDAMREVATLGEACGREIEARAEDNG